MSKQTELAQLGDVVTVDNSGNVGIDVTGTVTADGFTLDGYGTFDNLGTNLVIQGTNAGGVVQLKNHDSTEDIELGQDYFRVKQGGSERMRIDSSGNLRVAKTSAALADVGHELSNEGYAYHTRDNNAVLYLNRKTSDGEVIRLQKDNSTVGSIGARYDALYVVGDGKGILLNSNGLIPTNGSGTASDNAMDVGQSSARYDDIYATNGSIQTSDRNEKQDIAELTDAEQRVAVAAKGLLRKFRWKSAVAEKGNEARTHFGIIAQDLQAAFAAEGLDASKYAMFISSTWWETQTEVDAVEADEENGIEAADAYTRTDTYDTAEEAPEGATQKTRLGVRYSELLAFIIGAL